MATAASNFINHGDPNATWHKEMKAYETMKATVPVGDPYVKRTNKEIKLKETAYNPITQKYTNASHENAAKKYEQSNFLDVIAQNKVLFNVLFKPKGPSIKIRADI
jgi:hypothetical protein